MRPELEAITKTIKESVSCSVTKCHEECDITTESKRWNLTRPIFLQGYDPKVTEANQKRMKDLFTK